MKRKCFIDVLSLEPKKALLNGWCILVTFVDKKGVLHRHCFPFYKVHLRSKDCFIVDPYIVRGILGDDLFLNKQQADYILDLLKEPYEVKKPNIFNFLGL